MVCQLLKKMKHTHLRSGRDWRSLLSRRAQPLPDDVLELQRLAFRYFLDHTNAKNGLVADNTRADSPCSIAATGLGLSCHPGSANKCSPKRAAAAGAGLTSPRCFHHRPPTPEPDVTRDNGFYYHVLHINH